MTKKAFITGVTGQDGSLLAEFLLGKNYKVYGLARKNSSYKNIEDLLDNKNFYLIHGDLLNNELLRFCFETHKFNEIYNLASQSNIRLSYDNPLETFNVTLMGVVSLLDSVKKYTPNSKVFQAGSSAMFGNSCDSDGYQRETTLFNPVSPYASSKLFAHNLSTNYRINNNLFVSNGILYNHESYKHKNLPGIINTIAKKVIEIKNNERAAYYIPNLKIELDLGFALDYVEAIWLTLQQPKPEDYIISSGTTYSIEYICNYLFSKLNMDYKKYIKTDSTVSHFISKGDCTKLKNLGWDPKFNINKTLDTILHSYEK